MILLSISEAAAGCTDGLDPSTAYPQIGVGINIFKTTQLLTSDLGTDGTSRMLFAVGNNPSRPGFSDPSCYQQYADAAAEDSNMLLEGSETVAKQVWTETVRWSECGLILPVAVSYPSILRSF